MNIANNRGKVKSGRAVCGRSSPAYSRDPIIRAFLITAARFMTSRFPFRPPATMLPTGFSLKNPASNVERWVDMFF